MIKKILPFLVISVFALWGTKALFNSGLFTGHDIWHQVARLYWYTKAIQDGQFPPYWIANLGNEVGYPLFFFSYHLPWLLAQPIIWLGFNVLDTIKILFILSFLLSGFFMYLLVNSIAKSRLPALLSSILYLWTPFHFLNIFVFASIGTCFVFAFLPLLLLGIYKLTVSSKLGTLFASVGLSLTLLSHAITFFSLLPLIFFFTLIQTIYTKNKLAYVLKLSLSVILGTGLSAFYLLPATYYKNLTQISNGAFSQLYLNNFLSFKDIIYSRWGFGTNDFSVQLGVINWLIILIGTHILLANKFHKETLLKRYFLFLFPVFIFNLFMTNKYSSALWQVLTKVIALDFPTVFLLSATFISAFFAGLTITSFKKKTRVLLFLFLVFGALYTNRNHLRVNQYTNFSLEDYLGAETTTNSYHEYFPKEADLKLLEIDQNYTVLPKDIVVSGRQLNTKGLSFSVELPEEREVSTKQLAFPGIKTSIDKRETLYKTDSFGRVLVNIPKGKHSVKVYFQETLIIILSKYLSLFSAIILLYSITKSYEKR